MVHDGGKSMPKQMTGRSLGSDPIKSKVAKRVTGSGSNDGPSPGWVVLVNTRMPFWWLVKMSVCRRNCNHEASTNPPCRAILRSSPTAGSTVAECARTSAPRCRRGRTRTGRIPVEVGVKRRPLRSRQSADPGFRQGRIIQHHRPRAVTQLGGTSGRARGLTRRPTGREEKAKGHGSETGSIQPKSGRKGCLHSAQRLGNVSEVIESNHRWPFS